MKNIYPTLIVLLFIALPYLCSSQSSSANTLPYEVHAAYPYISITREKLNEARTLTELNANYKSSWVRTYVSVEILTRYQGRIKKAMSKNDVLTQEQKDIMKMADAGTDISIQVHYIPENTLKHNEVQKMDFTFTVIPESEATYPGGQRQLMQYLKEKAIDKIPEGSFKDYDLTAVKFTVNEAGAIINAHVFQSVYQAFKNEQIDQLLLDAIRNMPKWKPAAHANGTKVKQEFVLTVGNMESCVVPLLSIRRD